MQNEYKQKSQLDAIPYISLNFYNWTIFGLAVLFFWLCHQNAWNGSFSSCDRASIS